MTINREAWLKALGDALRPEFEERGKPLPEKINYSCGFTSRKKAIGQCWYASASEGGAVEIFIHPGQAQQNEVAHILIHELCHAALPEGTGHGKEFKALATSFGLAGKMTATHGTEETDEILRPIFERIGPYPHKALVAANVAGEKPQAKIPQVNVECECGFKAKVRVDQLERGRATCPDGHPLLTKEERKEEGWG